MSLFDDLASAVNGAVALVNNATQTIINAGSAALSGGFGSTQPSYGGSGGFGGGGAGGESQPVQTTTTQTQTAISTPSVSQIYQIMNNVDIPVVSTIVHSTGAIEGFDYFTNQLRLVIGSMVDGISEEIQAVWNKLESIKDGIVTAIAETFTTVYSSITETLNSAFKFIGAGIDEMITSARQTYSFIRQYIETAIADAAKLVSDSRALIERYTADIMKGLSDLTKDLNHLMTPEKFGQFFAASLPYLWDAEI